MMYIRNENSRKKFPNPQQESAVVTSLDALTTERPPMFLSFLEQQEQQKKKRREALSQCLKNVINIGKGLRMRGRKMKGST